MKLFLLILFFQVTTGIYAKTKDTIVDCNYKWDSLKKEFIDWYKSGNSGGQSPTDNSINAIKSIENLQLLTIVHWGYDDKIHKGQLLTNIKVAAEVKKIFAELFQLQFPIKQMRPISDFGFSDETSMEANNASCFDYRVQTNSTKISKHAYGLAIDINPRQNPYKTSTETLPLNSNTGQAKGRIRMDETMGKAVIAIFQKYGWSWGGSWKSKKDFMHFEK